MISSWHRHLMIVIPLSLGLILGSLVYPVLNTQTHAQLIFLDVGQGDSSLIITQDQHRVLIDCGPPSGPIMDRLDQQIGILDRHLDLLIVTHGDTDHFGGCTEVIQSYRPKKIMINGVIDPENTSYTQFLDYASSQAEIIPAIRDTRISMSQITLNILHPPHNTWKSQKTNDNPDSVVILVSSPKVKALLMGDAPDFVEIALMNIYPDLDIDILKAGHHGSHSSTSLPFLQATSPDHVIISAGKDNSYGHPHPEIIDRITSLGMKLHQTQYQPALVFDLD